MRKINLIILALAFTLITLASVTFEQLSSAQPPNLSCQAISCGSTASCGSAGTVSGCSIRCYTGANIQCPSGNSGGGGASECPSGQICPELPTDQ